MNNKYLFDKRIVLSSWTVNLPLHISNINNLYLKSGFVL